MSNNELKLSLANFKPNTYIVVENKKDNDYFFIIRQGRVRISKSISPLLGETDSMLGPGDFFGVIGAMTGHPRIETALAIDEVSLIVCKRNQFGFLIKKNAPLALKIIRSFSNSLRHFDLELAKRTTQQNTHDENNPDNLYHVGEYYYQTNIYKIAFYIFSRYISLFPEGKFVNEAKGRISALGDVSLTNELDATSFNRSYKNGEMLFSEFEPGKELFIVQSGKVKITKIINNQELLIAVLNPGDIFGEMALLDNNNRAAGAIAFGDVNLIAVSKENFDKIVVQNVNMSSKLITLLSNRIWTIYRQLGTLLLASPLGRIYDTLLTHIMQNHIPIKPKRAYLFNFGPNELIKMVGMTGKEGETTLEKMFSNPIMSVRSGKIYCDDVNQLKKEVQFSKRQQEREMKIEQSKQKKVW